MKRLKEVVTKEFRNPFLDGALTGIYENLTAALAYITPSDHPIIRKIDYMVTERISSIDGMNEDLVIYNEMRGATRVLTCGISLIGMIAGALKDGVYDWKKKYGR